MYNFMKNLSSTSKSLTLRHNMLSYCNWWSHVCWLNMLKLKAMNLGPHRLSLKMKNGRKHWRVNDGDFRDTTACTVPLFCPWNFKSVKLLNSKYLRKRSRVVGGGLSSKCPVTGSKTRLYAINKNLSYYFVFTEKTPKCRTKPVNT